MSQLLTPARTMEKQKLSLLGWGSWQNVSAGLLEAIVPPHGIRPPEDQTIRGKQDRGLKSHDSSLIMGAPESSCT